MQPPCRSPRRRTALATLLAATAAMSLMAGAGRAAEAGRDVAPAAAQIPAAEMIKLPVVDIPASAGTSRRLAFMLSGDGGWADLDQDLAAELASRGIAVTGLSSLKYFWRARSPEQAATDITRLLEQELAETRRERLLLIGYSFGADVLPFVINRLPPELRARIDAVALLGFSDSARFEISVAEWLPGVRGSGQATLPELRHLAPLPVLCVHGADERNSACPAAASASVENAAIGSGHHFSGRVAEIADALLRVADAAR